MNQGPTVFVVDDEPTVLKSCLRLLRIAGYKAEGFACGREFIRQYDAATGGCLVLDLSLSETTGLEVQEWMAKMGNPLPIIFLTGQDIIPSGVLSTKEGVVEVLIKPVIGDDLIKAIERALAWDRARSRCRALAGPKRRTVASGGTGQVGWESGLRGSQ